MLKKCYPLFTLFYLVYIAPAFSQVELQTGRPLFNISLFHFDDASRLSCDITLNYSGGNGIRVNQTPTTVGLGWELISGGVITRRANGLPDDQTGGIYDGDRIGTGHITSGLSTLSPAPLKGAYLPLLPNGTDPHYYKPDSTVLADGEQDNFIFQFGGRSGSFVINREGEIYPLDKTKLRIEKIEKNLVPDHIVTRIKSFIITDENGVRYKFDPGEISNIITYENGNKLMDGTRALITQRYKTSSYSVINSWVLTEISDPFSGSKITFTYSDYNVEYLQSNEGIYSTTRVDGVDQAALQFIQSKFAGTKKRLTAINLPGAKTEVKLVYSDSELVDLPGERALAQLQVLREGIQTSGYQFNYQYYFKDSVRAFNYSFNAAELPYARLCLKSVQKMGLFKMTEPPYEFSYLYKSSVTPATMPARVLGGQDYWGYFNGDTNFGDFSNVSHTYSSVKALVSDINRRPSSYDIPSIGLLKQIIYPGGGKLLYEYENNTALFGVSSVLSGGVRVKRTTLIDMVDTSKKMIRDYRYVKTDGGSSGWGYEAPRYDDSLSTYYVIPPSQYPGTVGSLSYSVATTTMNDIISNQLTSFTSISGSFAWNMFAGIAITIIIDLFTPPPSTKVMTVTSYQKFSAHPAKANELPHMYKRVEVFEGAATDNIGKIVYEFTSPDDFPLFVPVQQPPFSAIPRCLPWEYGLLKRKVELSQSNKPVSEIVNNYSLVTGDDGPGKGNIKWKATQMLVCPENLFSSYYGSGSRMMGDGYVAKIGRALINTSTEKKYDTTGAFVQSVTSYNYDSSTFNPIQISAVNSTGDTVQKRIYYQDDYNPTNSIAVKVMRDANMVNIPIAQETWLLNSSGRRLTDASITDFRFLANGDIKGIHNLSFQNDSPIPLSVAGSFNANVLNRLPTYVKAQQSFSFDGNSKLLHVSSPNAAEGGYQWGYNKEYVVAAIQNAHMAHTEKSLTLGTVNNGSINANGNETKTVSITLAQAGTICIQLNAVVGNKYNGEARSCRFTLSGGNPLTTKSGTLCNVGISDNITDAWDDLKQLYPRTVVFGDLPAGTYTLTVNNFTWYNFAAGQTTTLNYSYCTDPSSSFTSEIFYEGFEENVAAATDNPFTGKKYLLGDYTVPFTMPNARSYKVDYRYLSSGKWIYNSKPYTNNMVLSDGTGIDEIRVYPTDAIISTRTYDPLIGLTSESDQNGNTTIYEYDPLGHISIVRDQDRNILRRICYNYAGEIENCGGSVFGNVLVSQSFLPTNCSSGFTPHPVVYTVPAGTYTSDDQRTADAKALSDIQKNGQAYANQQNACDCTGNDHAVINGVCELGTYEDFIEPVAGGKCRSGYWYRFSDGSHSPKILGGFVNCP
ncbi:DUF5977 domain-containing protein [Chryseobacterium paludis]|uniref:DUF5977 domain-containing protein n=1 Tax=Chryseobacterium paludis TaxID=2956784 RepID=UPI0021C149C7|nr:DUF5977 domain-containing protein [Chryseobacterium paludis]